MTMRSRHRSRLAALQKGQSRHRLTLFLFGKSDPPVRSFPGLDLGSCPVTSVYPYLTLLAVEL